MPDKFLKPYNPQTTETLIYKKWEDSGYFNPDNLPGERTKPYTIVMPPPNANGSLHAGHALFITLEDIFIRFKRMQGYKALWIPGADHAGFETWVVYEKKLEKEGRSRFGMNPSELYNEIYGFTLKNKEHMEEQVRYLGASCDWSREKFTLEPGVIEKVQQTFIKMFADNLIYRGKRTVNWCPKHQTSLSDVETENFEEITKFYYFQYGPFQIATVRPETKFGDKYVVVHPDDKRYSTWKHGDTFNVEWINGTITATVIKDTSIDMNFGTGAMTITPWHSQIDFEIATRHHLDIEQIIDWRGKLLPIAGEMSGMKILEAREKVVEKLKLKGLLLKVDDQYEHVVKRCYKCNNYIEPQILSQWFVKMEPLAQLALTAVNNQQIKFIPSNYEKIFRYWMEHSLDWNISRQIVWGIPIPAYICEKCESYKVSMENSTVTCDVCSEKMHKDTDTFDTWFSSGQWPLIVTDYPSGNDFGRFYPTNLMETGHDLIFKWIPRMIMFGLYLTKQVPFHTVYLHGLVNDSKGKKMSKSKGNVVDPLELIKKYGTDALRIGLVVGNPPGADLALSEEKIKGYKFFANKLWNIARFILENKDLASEKITEPNDLLLLQEFQTIVQDVTQDLEQFRVHLAAEKIYHYVWDKLASELIEQSKPILKEANSTIAGSRERLLLTIFTDCLKLLHPFMPFISEEIWASMDVSPSTLLMIASWPV